MYIYFVLIWTKLWLLRSLYKLIYNASLHVKFVVIIFFHDWKVNISTVNDVIVHRRKHFRAFLKNKYPTRLCFELLWCASLFHERNMTVHRTGEVWFIITVQKVNLQIKTSKALLLHYIFILLFSQSQKKRKCIRMIDTFSVSELPTS